MALYRITSSKLAETQVSNSSIKTKVYVEEEEKKFGKKRISKWPKSYVRACTTIVSRKKVRKWEKSKKKKKWKNEEELEVMMKWVTR